MRYPIDELLDKKSIIQLKIERIKDYTGKERLKKEFSDYENAVGEYKQAGISEEVIEKGYKDLYEVNGKVWDLEAAVRQGRDKELGLEELGRRCIAVRELNKVRIKIKSQIVEATGIGYPDIKINHVSAKSNP